MFFLIWAFMTLCVLLHDFVPMLTYEGSVVEYALMSALLFGAIALDATMEDKITGDKTGGTINGNTKN